ncbi:MAG: tyrosine-type recombinase/integrase [Flavobacteriaceae bacterium]|nr:tyrosine-type recombinase/integrase [Flavobacteriaceae bacterium]
MSIPLFIEYISYEKNYSPNTVTAYKKDLETFQSFCKKDFDEISITNVPYTIIRSWIVNLVEVDVSNRSINRKISSLKSYYNFLQKTKQISQNPLRKHQSLKTPKKINVPFSKKEVNEVIQLFDNKEDFESIRNRLIIEILYTTGMRRAELIGLKNASVDLSQNIVKVLGKRNKERQIPLLNSVVETIKHYQLKKEKINLKDDNFFITKKGEKLYPTFVYRIINEYFSKVSVKAKKSPHVIRHSFATHLLNEGADLNSVKELLGHSSLASTQVYTHNNLKELKKTYNNAHPRSNKNY